MILVGEPKYDRLFEKDGRVLRKDGDVSKKNGFNFAVFYFFLNFAELYVKMVIGMSENIR